MLVGFININKDKTQINIAKKAGAAIFCIWSYKPSLRKMCHVLFKIGFFHLAYVLLVPKPTTRVGNQDVTARLKGLEHVVHPDIQSTARLQD